MTEKKSLTEKYFIPLATEADPYGQYWNNPLIFMEMFANILRSNIARVCLSIDVRQRSKYKNKSGLLIR